MRTVPSVLLILGGLLVLLGVVLIVVGLRPRVNITRPTAAPPIDAPPRAPNADLEALKVRVGGTQTVQGVCIAFEAVEQDNRCPLRVQYATAGGATARIAITDVFSRATRRRISAAP